MTGPNPFLNEALRSKWVANGHKLGLIVREDDEGA